MIGADRRIAASKVAVPDVTREKFETDRKSLAAPVFMVTGRSSGRKDSIFFFK